MQILDVLLYICSKLHRHGGY